MAQNKHSILISHRSSASSHVHTSCQSSPSASASASASSSSSSSSSKVAIPVEDVDDDCDSGLLSLAEEQSSSAQSHHYHYNHASNPTLKQKARAPTPPPVPPTSLSHSHYFTTLAPNDGWSKKKNKSPSPHDGVVYTNTILQQPLPNNSASKTSSSLPSRATPFLSSCFNVSPSSSSSLRGISPTSQSPLRSTHKPSFNVFNTGKAERIGELGREKEASLYLLDPFSPPRPPASPPLMSSSRIKSKSSNITLSPTSTKTPHRSSLSSAPSSLSKHSHSSSILSPPRVSVAPAAQSSSSSSSAPIASSTRTPKKRTHIELNEESEEEFQLSDSESNKERRKEEKKESNLPLSSSSSSSSDPLPSLSFLSSECLPLPTYPLCVGCDISFWDPTKVAGESRIYTRVMKVFNAEEIERENAHKMKFRIGKNQQTGLYSNFKYIECDCLYPVYGNSRIVIEGPEEYSTQGDEIQMSQCVLKAGVYEEQGKEKKKMQESKVDGRRLMSLMTEITNM